MAVAPANSCPFGSASYSLFDFSSVSDELKAMLGAHAEKQQKRVQAVISEVVAKMPVPIRARVALRSQYPDDQTALLFFFNNLGRNKDSISPFYHALESLNICPPPDGKWSFRSLVDYLPLKTSAIALSVVVSEVPALPEEEVVQERKPEMDELTRQFKQLSLEISQQEVQNRELKTTLDLQKYSYQQLHGQLQLLLNRMPAQEAVPKRDIEGILGDLKVMLKKYAIDREISIVAVIAQIVAKMPSQVQGKLWFVSQNSNSDETVDVFLGNVLRHKAQNYLYHALEALNIKNIQWKFTELTDYIPNGQAEAPSVIKPAGAKEAAYDPLSRDYPNQVPLAKYQKLLLENENRKLTEELSKLKEDLKAVTEQLQRWGAQGKW